MNSPRSAPALMTPQQQLDMRMRASEKARDDNTAFGKDANLAAVKKVEEANKAAVLTNSGTAPTLRNVSGARNPYGQSPRATGKP